MSVFSSSQLNVIGPLTLERNIDLWDTSELPMLFDATASTAEGILVDFIL